MPEKLSILVVLFQPMAVTITLVYAFGVSARWMKKERTRNILMGLLFGFAAILAMEVPIQISEGVLIDLRTLFVGLAAGLFGWLAGLIALVVGVTMRLYVGGAGAFSGVVAMCIAVIAGLMWRNYLRPRIASRAMNLVALGGCISLHLGAAFLLPSPVIVPFLTEVAPSLVVCNFVGTLVIGGMIHRENLILSETEQLRVDARTDPLTKLMNRRHLKVVFDALVTDNDPDTGRALLYFDLDGFKKINDTHGHNVGDEILRTICDRISGCLRPQDLFSRLGGDEFLIVLPNVTVDVATRVAERCRQAVRRNPIIADGQKVAATISIGVNWAQTPPSFMQDLAIADDALYHAKRNGRDCVTVEPQNVAA